MNTNQLVTITFALGVAAAAGCGSDVTATASGVFPAQGFVGRSLRVEISGDATKWKDGAVVSFGDGVTVNSVEVASPTDLFAELTIDPGAAAGMRDVTVTSGGAFTLSQAFELVPPVELVVQGNAGQGGLPFFTLINHDVDNPFDTTSDPSTGGYLNLSLSGPAGVDFIINSASELTIHGQAFIDLDASAGALSLASGAGTSMITNQLGNFPVVARTPTVITGPTDGMIMVSGDSNLYSIAATGTPSFVHVSVTAQDPNAAPGAAVFTDNSWNNVVGLHEILSAPGTVTFLIADVNGGAGYGYTVSAAGEMLNSAAEGANDTTNGTNAGALAATLPFRQTGGQLSSATDVDEISFVVTAAEVTAGTNHVHVTTDAGADANTDTAVEVVNAAGTAFTDDGFGSPIVDESECGFGCSSLGEDTVSKALPAGTYYVKITAGLNYATAHKAYVAMLWLE
jgi:hypothetical protein